jgi:Zn-dependent M28 family amino/carboxypeptidase
MMGLNLVIPHRVTKPARARNVIGLLRGSDPVLKDTYILVTAHYDHLGMQEVADGDGIYNGANDDGSGTVAVIELASALSKLRNRPKRSLVFMTFYGEEGGLVGSRYYAKHPVFPLAKTVADINLELLGRTDSAEGPQVNRASMTGFDYSDIGPIFARAGALTGIEVYRHGRNSDAFFSRSDNQALADAGVPAHTLCVSFDYPDYHRVSDHWDRIDYVTLARTSRMVAVGLWMVGNNDEAPRWNEENPRAGRYVEAWKRLHKR